MTQWYPKLPGASSQTATPPVLVFGIIPTPLNEEESKRYTMAMYAWRFAAQIADDDKEDEFKHVKMTRWLPFRWEPEPEDCVSHDASGTSVSPVSHNIEAPRAAKRLRPTGE